MMISTVKSRWEVFRRVEEADLPRDDHNSDIAGKSGVDCNSGSGWRDSREISNTVNLKEPV
jgi:hypothetical protein